MLPIFQGFFTLMTFYFNDFLLYNQSLCKIDKDLNFLNVNNLHLKNKSTLEEFANINILKPNNDIWSVMVLDNIITILIIVILLLPLIFCFLLLIMFLWNQYFLQLKGKQNKFEFWEQNYWIIIKDFWWKLWSYAYEFTPRYTYKQLIFEFDKNIHLNKFKFPNPKHSLYLFYNLFFIKHWPKFLKMIIYFLLISVLIFTENIDNLFLYLICYCLFLYIDNRWDWRRWVFGFYYVWTLSFFQKKKNIKWNFFFEQLFNNFHLNFYPLFFSFFLFILSTCFTYLMYMDFFFKPILVWNGYFSKTIITFFLSASDNTNNKMTSVVFDYFIAFDGLNIWLIWLTSLLVYLCVLFLLDNNKLYNSFSQIAWIFLLEFASFQFFCVPNYFWMYIYFELSLLPIFILIIFWGSNRWKVHAAYQMVIFTFVGSLFLLAGVFLLFIKIWSFNCFDIFYVTQADSLNTIFSTFEKKIIWLLLFIGFAVKTPLYPFHIWLPEAHSEAPTTGSVLLAGVLLKMGTYGFLRFVIPLFPSVLETFKTLVFSMCLCGILLSSLAALAQIDIKKIIAYSSIGHMGLVIIGIFNLNMNGLLGASYMMLSHGLISSALFFSIGILYKIYGTRSIIYYTSIAHFMPWFAMCFFFFNLANMSFPGTAGFPGELLIFASMMADNFFLSLFVGLGSIFGGVYSIWLLTWVLYGQISPKISVYWDIKSSEWKILNFLLILILLFGVFPFLILDFFKPMCSFFISLNIT